MTNFKWNDHGLMPVVVQDAKTNQILMLAYMNEEALKKTLKTKVACYYSRTRKKLWVKGETSGHTQKVVEVLTDCDCDTLILKVEQLGGACHLGFKSCFVNRLDESGNIMEVTQKKVFNPEKVYKTNADS